MTELQSTLQLVKDKALARAEEFSHRSVRDRLSCRRKSLRIARPHALIRENQMRANAQIFELDQRLVNRRLQNVYFSVTNSVTNRVKNHVSNAEIGGRKI